MLVPVGITTHWLPLKLKALPTSPAACVAPPTRAPGLVPPRSGAVAGLVPSPVHQPTRPEGGAAEAALTVRMAVSLPPLGPVSVTRTSKLPISGYGWLALKVKTPASSDTVV